MGPIGPTPPGDTSLVYRSYLALGDSYTIGTSVSSTERFPVQTTIKLNALGLPTQPAEIIATNGWTTSNLLNALNNTSLANNYDFVSLLIGVNNQYQGRSQEEYRNQFSTLLTKAIAYARGNKNRVFVLSIPDYSVTPFAAGSDTVRISDEIDQFNAINKEISLQMGVQYIDITPISRSGRTDATMQAGDGLHPSGKQYEKWASVLAPRMKAAL
ncbi:MAG: SGNH/GDSL hydrolase family protein [Chitinophagaceae bacterium]|nr:MAG: SGNH/GDSL hydrolase family protein [Chitinophagaceae bacterium]